MGVTQHIDLGYRRGDPGYRRITLALFAAGMTTFVAMYGAQAVLPQISAEFHASAATSALTVSATTGALALLVIPASVLSERYGRLRVMTTSAVASALIGLVLPLVSSLGALVALRGLQGLALAGVPATAMAYLAEEVDPRDLGAAMSRYVAGTTLGGLAGRLIASFTLDLETWRWALEVVALTALAFTAVLLLLAPRSRFFTPQPVGLRATGTNLLGHLRTPRLLGMFATAFLLMGTFVSAYNVLGFRLLQPPFDLPAAVVGLVFLLYLSGTVSASVAGRLADRFGRGRVLAVSEGLMLLGILITWPDRLVTVIAGMLLLTTGFFAAHAVASGWVGVLARQHRAEASSLYLAAYYLGSAVLGALAGLAWATFGWAGVVVYLGGLVTASLAVATWVRRTAPTSPTTSAVATATRHSSVVQ